MGETVEVNGDKGIVTKIFNDPMYPVAVALEARKDDIRPIVNSIDRIEIVVEKVKK